MARPSARGTDVERYASLAQDGIAALPGDEGIELGGRHIRRVVQRLETRIALRQVQPADEIAKLATRDMVTGAKQRLHGDQYVGIEADPCIDLLDHVASIVLKTQADVLFQQIGAEHKDEAVVITPSSKVPAVMVRDPRRPSGRSMRSSVWRKIVSPGCRRQLSKAATSSTLIRKMDCRLIRLFEHLF